MELLKQIRLTVRIFYMFDIFCILTLYEVYIVLITANVTYIGRLVCVSVLR
jgi:hypothetical protein